MFRNFVNFITPNISVIRSIATTYQCISSIFEGPDDECVVLGLKEDRNMLTKYSSRHGRQITSSNLSMTVNDVTKVTLATRTYLALSKRFGIFSVHTTTNINFVHTCEEFFGRVIFCVQRGLLDLILFEHDDLISIALQLKRSNLFQNSPLVDTNVSACIKIFNQFLSKGMTQIVQLTQLRNYFGKNSTFVLVFLYC